MLNAPTIWTLSTFALQASAQLLSCAEVNCPLSYGSARCNIDNTTLTRIGVTKITSSLSSKPLTWTVGYSPEAFTHTSAQRRFYLGTPQGLNLNSRTDVTGCALFFTGGIESTLRFAQPDATLQNLGTMSGTCADALGSTCVADLIDQARSLATNSTVSGGFRCADIAQALQLSPPATCKRAGSWGNVTARSITGPDSPTALKLNDCNPTTDSTYDVRSVATFSQAGSEAFGNNITPLMTIFVPTGANKSSSSNPEVQLSCMKPIQDEASNTTRPTGSGDMVSVGKSLPAATIALVMCLFVTVLGI